MSITLVNNTTSASLTLNPDLFWSDEYTWNPVGQTADRGITGAYIIHTAGMVSGRPITLEPEDDSSAWTPRSQVETLRNWAAEPGLEMTLTLRGQARTVIFRHQDGGFEARPVLHFREPLGTDFYLVVIRLMEVETE